VSYDWVRFVEKIARSLVQLPGNRGDPRQCAPHGVRGASRRGSAR
jgi:hypothetical protein